MTQVRTLTPAYPYLRDRSNQTQLLFSYKSLNPLFKPQRCYSFFVRMFILEIRRLVLFLQENNTRQRSSRITIYLKLQNKLFPFYIMLQNTPLLFSVSILNRHLLRLQIKRVKFRYNTMTSHGIIYEITWSRW